MICGARTHPNRVPRIPHARGWTTLRTVLSSFSASRAAHVGSRLRSRPPRPSPLPCVPPVCTLKLKDGHSNGMRTGDGRRGRRVGWEGAPRGSRGSSCMIYNIIYDADRSANAAPL